DGQSVLSIAQGLERLLLNVALVQQELLTQRQLGMKVLVAEDNPINQMTLRDQLEQLGCQVTLADDGEDALAMWDMEAHDVVLTDVNMPRMNGY
ncbi:MAG: response regulator, partial [Comamonadaceae bacterium]|nr:response regulator [Comamonadaceae bacterium]